MTEWKEYTGADEQIAEMMNAKHGVILRNHEGEESLCIFTDNKELEDHLDPRSKYPPMEYLICNPHPLADMIIRQAQTGQPVYTRNKLSGQVDVTTEPDWNFNGLEYSFTPFED